MIECVAAALGGVVLGYALASGQNPRAIAKALGYTRTAKLLEVLEELEEPAPDAAEVARMVQAYHAGAPVKIRPRSIEDRE